MTRDLATTGQITGVNQSFAIVLDNQMESDPIVDYKQNPDGIQGTSAEITGNFTIQEAKDLALVINTGALPVTLHQIESQEVSATLGKDSLHEALIAGIAGLGLILLYMIFYYRFLGLVADIALIIYGVLLFGLVQRHPRHPDAAGHRRHDPDDRGGGRRQRRHLRAHQGRGAPRTHRALGGQLGLRARLSHHPRRQRADAAHGGCDLRVRLGAAQGLRLHADPRRAGQHVHGGGRHARPARPAVRLRLLQPAGVHGRQGRRHPRGRRRRRRRAGARGGARPPRRRPPRARRAISPASPRPRAPAAPRVRPSGAPRPRERRE